MTLDLGMFLSFVEFLARAAAWLRGRRRELRCMPVIDWVKEREENEYCTKGRQIWAPDQSPGGSSRIDLPIVQLDLHWPNKKGLPTVPLTILGLQSGYIQGCIVQSPENPDYYRAFVSLTYKGRRAWARYCTDRRMRRRSRVFFIGPRGSEPYQFRRRDPRTSWSLYPPESSERIVRREQADVTYGWPTPDIEAKLLGRER